MTAESPAQMFLPLPLFAQAATEIVAPAPTIEDDKLRLCIENAGKDPATAIADASRWVAQSRGSDKSKPLECLGQIYTVLGKWDAAEGAFSEAARLAGPDGPVRRAALYTQAGNAALAAGKGELALERLDTAAGVPGIEPVVRGQIAIDRGRALVAMGRDAEATAAFAAAQRDAPEDADAWLLGATLARRRNDLDAAQRQIAVAASLSPNDPVVALEAGVVAMLAGNEKAARTAWQSAIALAPTSKTAETAKGYLAQLSSVPEASTTR